MKFAPNDYLRGTRTTVYVYYVILYKVKNEGGYIVISESIQITMCHVS